MRELHAVVERTQLVDVWLEADDDLQLPLHPEQLDDGIRDALFDAAVWRNAETACETVVTVDWEPSRYVPPVDVRTELV